MNSPAHAQNRKERAFPARLLNRLSRLLPIVSLLVAAAPVKAESNLSVVVSVPEQRLYVFDAAGEEVTRYSVSTSKFGTGGGAGTYNTPLGMLEIAAKHGAGAVPGTVFKNCARTGEVLKVNAPGRDPIVTRILCLRGKESQNANAYGRRIYIHGTPEERTIGSKASYGCIRMRSRDVIALFETVGVGTSVEITNDRVGSLFGKATRTPPVVVAVAAKAEKVTTRPVAERTLTAGSTTPRPIFGSADRNPVIAWVPTSEPMNLTEGSGASSSSGGKSKTPKLSLSEPLIGEPTPPPKSGKKKGK